MKFCVYLFLFSLVFRPAFPFLDYVLNYQYIATELCENKTKPQLGCNGKCHLKKELIKAYKDETPSSNDKKSETTETVVLFIVKIPVFTFETSTKSILKVNSVYQNLYSHLNTGSVFRPPIFSC
ncbi:hypothetical protein [Flavobacterium branchiicola]|uniref:Uncharacterized protein n=1 Tax=Flavobacterium branchiicola TaxID=1114875 RepID=A0ABV9P9N0_9FLAO|nr:hypothetical protein [Flavobacterium branchiicola]MBS7253569.1 hypothetical protein [Flavobacterium branchiicola]